MRRGGRDESRMVGNTWTPPTVPEIHDKWVQVWRRLTDAEFHEGREVSDFAKLQRSMAEEIVLDLSAALGTAPCGRCPRKPRWPCPHFVERRSG